MTIHSPFVAHILVNDNSITTSSSDIQLLVDHLQQAAKLAGKYGQDFGLPTACYLAGLLHDCGKYSDEFQDYIRLAQIHPDQAIRGSVDHSYAGALLIWELTHSAENKNQNTKIIGELISNAISAHHSQSLNDYLVPEPSGQVPSFIKRLSLDHIADQKIRFKYFPQIKERFFTEIISQNELNDLIDLASNELSQLQDKNTLNDRDYFFIGQNIFSALIDADRTNTMLFELNKSDFSQDNRQYLTTYRQKLEKKITEMAQSDSANQAINHDRSHLSAEAAAAASRPTGIYRLLIPTGGGKTLASMRFALKHAQVNQQQRIIFIEPFTTIIEQNAEVFRKIFTDPNRPETDFIVEHHSNLVDDQALPANPTAAQIRYQQQIQLIHDTWDGPVVFTTSVAFLNAIFGSGTRNLRRFHNLNNAVIIFDEAQAFPLKTLQMFVSALNYLKKLANTTSVLCTATQPALDILPEGLEFSADRDIIPDYETIEPHFSRVKINNCCRSAQYSVNDIVDLTTEKLTDHPNTLVILNTKKIVHEVYQQLANLHLPNTKIFHLSTNMCAQHRLDLLNGTNDSSAIIGQQIGIKAELKNNSKERIIVVTTPLIEAGVDISFSAVIRSMTGLDSIAQAAGRCNRNNEMPQGGDLYLINPNSQIENISSMKDWDDAKILSSRILDLYEETPTDLLTATVQQEYFEFLYQKKNNLELQYPVNNGIKLYQLLADNPVSEYNLPQALSPTVNYLASSPKYIANHFQVINDLGHAVIVPYNDEAKEIINQLLTTEKIDFTLLNQLLKRSQRYTITISQQEYIHLKQNRLLLPIGALINSPHAKELLDSAYQSYQPEYGLELDQPVTTFNCF
ncbi:CRISPR-associated helicase Cas3' [Lapidilactobacillus wuchangensis]|uniref:CRISPR-associated helicase Cas3' n=1 Tax=Lapidilactobacillus wuchangensis TaxID=2486001 RepID=UPI000F77C6AC|nr:CRISPR-associated helicase Cas3' [Lapidilactobacillus wuchangensis]